MEHPKVTPSGEAIMSVEDRMKINQRRQASMYLGVDDERAHEVRMTTEELIAKVKSQFLAEINKSHLSKHPKIENTNYEQVVCKKQCPTETKRDHVDFRAVEEHFHQDRPSVSLSPAIPTSSKFEDFENNRPATARSIFKRCRKEVKERPATSELANRQHQFLQQHPCLPRTSSYASSTPSSFSLLSKRSSQSSHTATTDTIANRQKKIRKCFQ